MSKNLSLSISIVVYKPDIEILKQAFHCLTIAFNRTQAKFNAEFSLYLIDNTPNDEYTKQLQHVLNSFFLICHNVDYELISSPENLGYGHGNNLAINRSNAKYHLVLNPDVFVEEDTILNAIDYMESHEDVGLLTPAVFGEDGERHYLCKRNPTLFDAFLRSFAPNFIKKMFSRRMQMFEMRDRDYDKAMMDISFPTGCFMFFRNSNLQSLHGFDEDFFMYLEDADIGRRLLTTSHSVYVPAVKIIHKWARGSHNDWRLRWVTIKSAFIYWRKWGGIFKT